MLDKPEVAFRKTWLRDVNSGMARRVDVDDATRILSTIQSNTTDMLETLKSHAPIPDPLKPGRKLN